ncbi:alpha-N-acetylglucosaminidase-like [Tubulanus polymorphus]|uniref:alpha-N-acetylglucosaminidase-like n=1 Tax=Tubulanus polymorphus TaxID=672921 RepID=UPI003DA21003
MNVLLLLLALCGLKSYTSTHAYYLNYHTKVNQSIQKVAVEKLINRLIPHRANSFSVRIVPDLGKHDQFNLISKNNRVYISGNSGVAAAWGFHYFLVQYCNSQITWAGKNIDMPANLPNISEPGITVTANDQFRYYANVVTFSYSFVWWNWTRWEQEIDWMAMNGINLPLAFVGQEYIWKKLYLKFGFEEKDIISHFGGPAFLAWSRMGNLRGWGGPPPKSWFDTQHQLQLKIISRMREFGMLPVLPAFAGHVPEAFTRLFPNASVSRLPKWSHFNCTYSCTYLLDFEDPLFTKIGKEFMHLVIEHYGTDHIYNCDSFNEMTPTSSDPAYLRKSGKAIYTAMASTDEKAIWLMQGWLFLNDAEFWQEEQAKALLTSVPQGKMLVLDLMAEQFPQWKRLNSFYGQPFIWCMLHNFGGALGMYGRLDSINKGPILDRENSTMVGIGLSMEGINQNELVYQFMLENSWRQTPVNISSWLMHYTKSRYGFEDVNVNKAWQMLSRHVLNCKDNFRHHGKYIITKRPSRYVKPEIWYNAIEVFKSWSLLLKADKRLYQSPLFQYDLVDITRQSLQVLAIRFYAAIISTFTLKNIPKLREAGQNMAMLLTDLDDILATDSNYLLGNWLSSAKSIAKDETEKRLYEFNARNQITLWGPQGEIKDYATKQWSGIVKDYYKPRWQLFVNHLITSLEKGQKYNQSIFVEDVFKSVEQPFTYSRSSYPTTPVGSTVPLAQKLYQKYSPYMSGKLNRRFFRKVLQFRNFSETGKKQRRKKLRNLLNWMNKQNIAK